MEIIYKAKCDSVKDYIIELIEYQQKGQLYYNGMISDIINGRELTEAMARKLEKLFNINYKIFQSVDRMHKIEQKYIKRKYMQKIKGVKK